MGYLGFCQILTRIVKLNFDDCRMKLSKRGEYALRALIDLGVAHDLGHPLLSMSELSKKEQIPTTFLEQIRGRRPCSYDAGMVLPDSSSNADSQISRRCVERQRGVMYGQIGVSRRFGVSLEKIRRRGQFVVQGAIAQGANGIDERIVYTELTHVAPVAVEPVGAAGRAATGKIIEFRRDFQRHVRGERPQRQCSQGNPSAILVGTNPAVVPHLLDFMRDLIEKGKPCLNLDQQLRILRLDERIVRRAINARRIQYLAALGPAVVTDRIQNGERGTKKNG